jgi:hypothetical protein
MIIYSDTGAKLCLSNRKEEQECNLKQFNVIFTLLFL